MLMGSSPMGGSADHADCPSGHCTQCANDLVAAPNMGSEEGQANREAWNADRKSYGKVPSQVRNDQSPKSGGF